MWNYYPGVIIIVYYGYKTNYFYTSLQLYYKKYFQIFVHTSTCLLLFIEAAWQTYVIIYDCTIPLQDSEMERIGSLKLRFLMEELRAGKLSPRTVLKVYQSKVSSKSTLLSNQ